MNVSVAPEVLFNIGNIPITNTKTTALLLTVLFVVLGLYIRKTFSVVPTRLQIVVELALTFVKEQIDSAFNSKKRAKQVFPLIVTLLFFIFISNQLLIIPLLGQVILGETVVFRTLTSDISQAIALALIVLVATHVIAFSVSPLRHIGNFLKFGELVKIKKPSDIGNAFMEIALGFMDIIGEIAKVFSLSFRLFGNVFAGELVILVISSLAFATHFFVPIPFMVLSIFSGLVQALVFTMLSIQFMAGTVNSAGDADSAEELDKVKVRASELEPVKVKIN